MQRVYKSSIDSYKPKRGSFVLGGFQMFVDEGVQEHYLECVDVFPDEEPSQIDGLSNIDADRLLSNNSRITDE